MASPNFCRPLRMIATPVNALEARRVRTCLRHIPTILQRGTCAQVAPSAIEPILIFMIYLNCGILDAENESVERLRCQFPVKGANATGCVDLRDRAVTTKVGLRRPVELIRPLKVASVHNRDLALGKRNVANGLIERLNRLLALDAAFHAYPAYVMAYRYTRGD